MSGADGSVRPHYQAFSDWLKRTAGDQIAQKRDEAERAFHRIGITLDAENRRQAGAETGF
jgi:uncharacterized circularly permuted ATP-grasp superfamily protein